MALIRQNLKNHPIALIPDLMSIWPDATLEFARYIYEPTKAGIRRIFKIPANEVTEEWFHDQLELLAPNEEIALQSRVYTASKTFHIGMIDFACDAAVDPRPKLRDIFGDASENFVIYKSGRSYHAYQLVERTHDEWVKFLGTLIYHDNPNNPTFDARWVGHRLIDGYAALRWSCQTKQYKQLPHLYHC